MRFPSLEDVAERWTVAHTVMVAAWVLVLVLGVALLARGTRDPYPVTDQMKVYAGENATFTYPSNWTINGCGEGDAFMELPGTFKADYKGKKAYGLQLRGNTMYSCVKDRPERFDIYNETIVASDTPCAPALAAKGEHLSNGLYIQIDKWQGGIYGVSIHQNGCFAPSGTAVLAFIFADPNDKATSGGYVTPELSDAAFKASRQYKDIRALAESFRY